MLFGMILISLTSILILISLRIFSKNKKIENFTDEEFKQNNGWWNNVINCKDNGSNSIYCKDKKEWIFPY